MNVALRLSVLLALSSSIPLAADADEVSIIAQKLGTAANEVTSFVVQMQITGTTGVSGTTTFVRPLRMKSEFNIGQISTQMYFVDGTVYLHSPVAGWQKTTTTAAPLKPALLNLADSVKGAHVKLLPDRQENGVTVGAVQVEMQFAAVPGPPAQQAAQPLVCSYDKTTYRMQSCSNSFMSMTYSKYNDPANVVTLPPKAQAAVPIVLPSAMPVPQSAPTATATTPPQ